MLLFMLLWSSADALMQPAVNAEICLCCPFMKKKNITKNQLSKIGLVVQSSLGIYMIISSTSL